jgi:CRISPR/Cas system endoribonuclease Cas6 (RAMP superfamily)
MKYKEENIEIVKNFIENDFIEFIQDYFSIKINSNQFDVDSEHFKHGYSFYGDALIETILQNSCEFISDLINIKVVPTFSTTTMFMKDDIYINILNDSSEISAILFLGSSSNQKIDNELTLTLKNKKNINLNTGDLLVYNPKKIEFEKNIIFKDWVLQATFNFVDNEGNYKNNIYDNRPYLGFPIVPKKQET